MSASSRSLKQTSSLLVLDFLLRLLGVHFIVALTMPSRSHASREMSKRGLTATVPDSEQQPVKQKNNGRTCEQKRAGKLPEKHAKCGSSRDRRSPKRHPRKQSVPSRLPSSSKEQNGALSGFSSDAKSSLTELCETSFKAAVTPAAAGEVVSDDSASTSWAPRHDEADISTLESEYAVLSVSYGCSGQFSSARDSGLSVRDSGLSVCDSGSVPSNKHASSSTDISSGDITSKDVSSGDITSKDVSSGGLEDQPTLPVEMVAAVLGRLNWREVMRRRSDVGKDCRDAIFHPAFLRYRPPAEAEFSPTFFTTDAAGDLYWRGFDIARREWTTLPSLNFAKSTVLPSPDPDLFKDYLVAGDGGLLCINVGKSTDREAVVVCNPLTRQVKRLPPLQYSRHPVLMHFKLDDDNVNYKIVVAGSAAIGTESLSLKTEEYDSKTGEWESYENSDMPCPPFGLNEYQNGVVVTSAGRDLLLCVAIVDTRGRGVMAYDLKDHKWVPGLTRSHIPVVRNEANQGYLATTQILECGGEVYVFSEQEFGREVYFLIHKLNVDSNTPWEEILRRKRAGGRGLLVYPEFTCVPITEKELCIFNTVDHTMDVIDLTNPTEVAPLLPPPSTKANRFHSLNPVGFVFRPSFRSIVCPPGLARGYRCGPELFCTECEKRNAEILEDKRQQSMAQSNAEIHVQRTGNI